MNVIFHVSKLTIVFSQKSQISDIGPYEKYYYLLFFIYLKWEQKVVYPTGFLVSLTRFLDWFDSGAEIWDLECYLWNVYTSIFSKSN